MSLSHKLLSLIYQLIVIRPCTWKYYTNEMSYDSTYYIYHVTIYFRFYLGL